MTQETFILGGYQTDFETNYTKDGKDIFDLMSDGILGALAQTDIQASDIQCIHVGNFVSELFAQQGHLGGLAVAVHPDFAGIPTMRHEAACASGSMAILSAMSDIQSGRYDLVMVVGVELMRNVNGQTAAEYLGGAAWHGKEGQDAKYPWPYFFAEIYRHYQEKYQLTYPYLQSIAQTNYANASTNPLAQARAWQMDESSYAADDNTNPIIEGNLRKSDCGRITDGCSVIILASPEAARKHAQTRGLTLSKIPRIKGWGHHTATMLLQDKLDQAPADGYTFPWVKQTVMDALHRAQLSDIHGVDMIETHDCFTISEYVAIDHLSLYPPGEAWKAIEDGQIVKTGKLPINPSGGLLACGHPVGATGVRMVLDGYKQCTTTAYGYQIENVSNMLTINIGGSLTSIVSFVVGV